MKPGGRWATPARGADFSIPALLSLMLHGAALAALVLLHQRQPADAPPERGVEIFWDQEASEAVGEAEAPDSPGAPPEAPAPPEAEAPPPPPPAPPIHGGYSAAAHPGTLAPGAARSAAAGASHAGPGRGPAPGATA